VSDAWRGALHDHALVKFLPNKAALKNPLSLWLRGFFVMGLVPLNWPRWVDQTGVVGERDDALALFAAQGEIEDLEVGAHVGFARCFWDHHNPFLVEQPA
jgi:hypothetical protein